MQDAYSDSDSPEPAHRTYHLADLKKLFALSYNICDGPGCDERLADPRWPRVLAEICHIHGLRPGSARYVPTFAIEELNSYWNLLLLCRNCHLKVDHLLVNEFPAERLLLIKERHSTRGNEGRQWTMDPRLDAYVATLVTTLGLEVMAAAPSSSPPSVGSTGTGPRYVEGDFEPFNAKGRVKWFNAEKGYGFVTIEDGRDVFVHYSAIQGDGYRSLVEGQTIELGVVPGSKGAQATDVRVL